jgi:trehalose 6-phosphate phosphatase
MAAELKLANTCLFLDVDGTVLDIAARPTAIVLPPSLIDDLATVELRLQGALALVSGRPVSELDQLFAPLRLRAAGVHGAEVRFDPHNKEALYDEQAALPAEAWLALRELLMKFPGSFAENKRFAFAVHYRTVPQIEFELERALHRFVLEWRNAGFTLLPGHCVFEIKRPFHEKGMAIERFMQHAPFAGRTPIFIGDDTTDVPGFAAVRARGGQAYSVGRLMPQATGAFEDPTAVRAWLSRVAAGSQVMS